MFQILQTTQSPVLISEFVQLSRGSGGVSGVAYHCYAGEVNAMNDFHDAHPTSDVWFSEFFACLVCGYPLTGHEAECAGMIGGDWWSDLKWQTSNLWIGAPNNWARSALMWSLAADSNGVRSAITPGARA